MHCLDDYGNPNDFSHFDHVGAASLVQVQLMSTDGWAPGIMYPLMQAEYGFAFIYFVVCIVFLRFLCANLFIAVITTAFSAVRSALDRESAFTSAPSGATAPASRSGDAGDGADSASEPAVELKPTKEGRLALFRRWRRKRAVARTRSKGKDGDGGGRRKRGGGRRSGRRAL